MNASRARLRLSALLIAVPFASVANAQPAWQLAGKLGTARTLHTSTLLSATGEVLIVGGYNDSGYLDAVEVYEPQTQATRSSAPLSTARHSHTAHVLESGDVLVVGGYGMANYLHSVERYHANEETWSEAAPMAEARIGHAATILKDGKLLVSGGYNNGGMVKSLELYDPARDLWSTVAEMSLARARHSATLLEDGSVLLAGGFDGMAALDLVERYYPGTHVVSVEEPLQSARWFHGATPLSDGRVLLVGGQSVAGALSSTELFEPIAGTSRTGPALGDPRTQPSVTPDCDGGVVVSAGFRGEAPVVSSQRLLQGSEAFLAAEPMVSGRLEQTALRLADCSILVLGGRNENTYVKDLEVWTEVESGAAPNPPEVEGCSVRRSALGGREKLTVWAIALLSVALWLRRLLAREFRDDLL
jgi:hypothetical protein